MMAKKNLLKAPDSKPMLESEHTVPIKITKKIKYGWIAAVVSGLATFGISLFAEFVENIEGLFSIWNLIDAGLILILAYGVYKKSRIAATVLLLYFIGSKIILFLDSGQIRGAGITLIFLLLYFRAAMGTFEFHKFLKDADTIPQTKK